MPRGQNPNSRANLMPGRFNTENAREAKRLSDEKKAENKRVADHVLEQMDAEKLARTIVQRAQAGNIKFVELELKLIGQMPADNVNVITDVNPLIGMSAEELTKLYYGSGDSAEPHGSGGDVCEEENGSGGATDGS